MTFLAGALAVLLFGVSGCTSRDPGDGAAVPPPDGPPGGANSTAIRWEGCTGFVGNWEAPRDKARAVVPDAFRLTGDTSATASLMAQGLDCRRVILDEQVVEGGTILRLAARVGVVNESWGQERPSLYLLDVLIGPQKVSEAAGALGVPNVAAALTRSNVTNALGLDVERWTYKAQEVAAEVNHTESGRVGPTGDSQFYLWRRVGENFRRIESDAEYRYDLLVAGPATLRMSGSNVTGPLLTDCCTAWQGSAFMSHDEIWRGNETAYR